jgi:hypothetical protein
VSICVVLVGCGSMLFLFWFTNVHLWSKLTEFAAVAHSIGYTIVHPSEIPFAIPSVLLHNNSSTPPWYKNSNMIHENTQKSNIGGGHRHEIEK